MRKATVKATQVSTVREEITLETPKARVVQIGSRKDRKAQARKNRDLSWLAAATFSTPSAYRA